MLRHPPDHHARPASTSASVCRINSTRSSQKDTLQFTCHEQKTYPPSHHGTQGQASKETRLQSVVCLAEVTVHVAACELGVHVPVPRVQQGIVREHHGHSGRILCTPCRVPPDLTVIQCRSQIEPTKLLSCADLRSSSGDALAVTVDLPVEDQVTGSYDAATSVIMESGWS